MWYDRNSTPGICLHIILNLSDYIVTSLHAFVRFHIFVCYRVETNVLCLKVLPSQRQGRKTNLYEVWAVIHTEDCWILTGNCTCVAGLVFFVDVKQSFVCIKFLVLVTNNPVSNFIIFYHEEQQYKYNI